MEIKNRRKWKDGFCKYKKNVKYQKSPSQQKEAHTAQRIFVLRNEMRVGGERITKEENKNKKKEEKKNGDRERGSWLSVLTKHSDERFHIWKYSIS